VHPLIQGALAALTLTAAFTDIRSRRIPNWLVLAGLIVGLILNAYFGQWSGLRSALLGFGLAALVYFPLYALRAVGGGDVKLMLAVGALTGASTWFSIFVVTSIVGGGMALMSLFGTGGFSRVMLNVGTIFASLFRLRAPYRANPELDVSNPSARRLPHAVMIALGTLIVLLVTEWR
jgi:prepilin peptidase CpaA